MLIAWLVSLGDEGERHGRTALNPYFWRLLTHLASVLHILFDLFFLYDRVQHLLLLNEPVVEFFLLNQLLNRAELPLSVAVTHQLVELSRNHSFGLLNVEDLLSHIVLPLITQLFKVSEGVVV